MYDHTLTSYMMMFWYHFFNNEKKNLLLICLGSFSSRHRPVYPVYTGLWFTRRSCLVVSCHEVHLLRHTLSVKRLADSYLGSCLELLSPISQCTSSSTFFSHSNRLLKTSHFYVQSSKSKETGYGKLRWLAKWVEN